MKKKIYYTNNGKFYRMIYPPGHCHIKGYEYYALWEPIRRIRVLWWNLFITDWTKQRFFLDMEGFERVGR